MYEHAIVYNNTVIMLISTSYDFVAAACILSTSNKEDSFMFTLLKIGNYFIVKFKYPTLFQPAEKRFFFNILSKD